MRCSTIRVVKLSPQDSLNSTQMVDIVEEIRGSSQECLSIPLIGNIRRNRDAKTE